MNKSAIWLVFTLYFVVSCQNPTPEDKVTSNVLEKEFEINPIGNKRYTLSLTYKSLNSQSTIACEFKKSNNEVEMIATIEEMKSLVDSKLDIEINENSKMFIGEKITSFFDYYGKPIIKQSFEKKILNPDMFIVEFPRHKIKEGDTWNGEKSAKPDVVFEKMKVIYKLNKIETDNNVIEVEMDCVMDEYSDPILHSMTKTYRGEYVIYDDGTVKSAELTFSGFSGFSNINGNITIKEIPQVQSR